MQTSFFFETFAGESKAIQDYSGFAAYEDDGTNLSASTVDPLRVNVANSNFFVFIGSAAANRGGSYALISGAGSIDPSAYQNDRAFSINSHATDAKPTNSEMGWRFLAKVGSTIYASDFISYSTTSSEKRVAASDSVWHTWSGEQISATASILKTLLAALEHPYQLATSAALVCSLSMGPRATTD